MNTKIFIVVAFYSILSGYLFCQTSEDFFEKGKKEYFKGNYAEAIFYYNKAIDLDAKNINFLEARAEARFGNFDYKGTIEDYTKCIESEPEHPWFYLERAVAKNFIGDYVGAIGDFNAAIGIDRGYSECYVGRAVSKYLLKNYEGAIEDVNILITNTRINVLDLAPNRPDGFWAGSFYVRGAAKIAMSQDGCSDFKKLLRNKYQRYDEISLEDRISWVLKIIPVDVFRHCQK